MKAFHCEIINDHAALKKEQGTFKPIPLIRNVDQKMIDRNYTQIKEDIQNLIAGETERILNDPSLWHLVR